MRSARGQASVDYMAIVALVAVALGLAGAVAAPDLPAAVAHNARVALCIVGGDVCRAADARADGLAPCVTGESSRDHHGGLTFESFTVQGHDLWFVERRSDGSVRFTAANGTDPAIDFDIGVNIAPRIRGNAGLGPKLTWRSGKSWTFPSMAAAAGFLRRAEAQQFEPARLGGETESFHEGGGHLGASLSLAGIPGVEAGLSGALGRRVGRSATTWYTDAGSLGPKLLPDLADGGEAGLRMELTLPNDGRPGRRLALRETHVHGATVEEVTTSLDMDDPAARAALGAAWHGNPGPLRRRIASHGARTREVFEVERETRGIDLTVPVPFTVGYRNQTDHAVKRLREASVRLPSDPVERRRADCTLFAEQGPGAIGSAR